MESVLNIEDIGGIKGEKEFKFKKGKLNIIEAPNSSGKTSIIKALAGILSLNPEGEYKPLIEEEAKNLGLKSNERNPQQGFVNVHSDIGKVSLDTNNESLKYIVRQNGNIISSHNQGNQDFLLAGVLSNDSRILKQLNSVEGDEIEPGDFYWAVTELSSAKIYDNEVSFLKSKKEQFLDEVTGIEQKIYFLKDTNETLEELKNENEILDKELLDLESIIEKGGLKHLVKRKNELLNLIRQLNKQKSQAQAEKERNESNMHQIQHETNKLEKSLNNVKKDLKKNSSNFKSLEKRQKALENEKELRIPELKNSRNIIDGELNLFTTLLSSLDADEKDVNCPLCKTGKINYLTVKNHLNKLQKERTQKNNQIKEINMNYNEISNQIDIEASKAKKLNEKIEELQSKIGLLKRSLNKERISIDAKIAEIDRFNGKINKNENKRNKITEQLGGDDELVKEQENKQKKLLSNENKINDIARERSKSSITIGEVSFEPEQAKLKYNEIIDYVEKAIKHATERSDEQKQRAKINFNKNIAELIKKLGFKEFKGIKLNNQYQLYVERLDEDSGDYVLQQVKTLSTSEKSAIALILQIALKQMYVPDLDYLILDDVFANFDEDKKIKILDYLSNKANEEGWYIILTTLTDEEKELEIKYR